MKRPHLVHFLSLITEDFISIKASITMKENTMAQGLGQAIVNELPTPSFPIQGFRLLNAYQFKVKIVGLDKKHLEVFKKSYESDSFGNYNFKIPLTEATRKIEVLQLYEVGKQAGLDIHLGTYIPLRLASPIKLAISDFDKTLVDTRYSTTKDVFSSLTKPLEYFPTIPKSVDKLRSYIEKGFHPFILSASPHFYENAIRDWLYQNKIYTAGIFLKDYRQVFSLFESDLTPKDLKVHGMYKLNHLFDILLMTGVPSELILMGDNFESDPVIYLTLALILSGKHDPWNIWNSVRKLDAFHLNRRQNAQFLNKIYQINNLLARWKELHPGKGVTTKIYIRKRGDEVELSMPAELTKAIDYEGSLFDLYSGYS